MLNNHVYIEQMEGSNQRRGDWDYCFSNRVKTNKQQLRICVTNYEDVTEPNLLVFVSEYLYPSFPQRLRHTSALLVHETCFTTERQTFCITRVPE